MKLLILGGARSGKSRLGESLAHGEQHYVATAQAHDAEMEQRIAQHRERRGQAWISHEEPLELAPRLQAIDGAGRFILVDCLTLWLTNLLLAGQDCEAAVSGLVTVLGAMQADVAMVSNEVGLGIVPDTPLGRAFRDIQGIANQRVAAAADCVVFVAAGLPMVLKGQLPVRPAAQS